MPTMIRRSRSATFPAALALVFCALGSFPAAAQNLDPVLGTWTLDLSRSTFAAGRAPKRQTLVYSMEGRVFKTVSDGVDAPGKPTHVEFTIAYDGEPHPIVGLSTADAATYKRIDAYSVEFTRTLDGKVVQTGRRELSKDGETLTITTSAMQADGTTAKSIAVYARK